MAVETLTEFPESFIAGDTLRVTISDSDFPSTLWTLKVLLLSASERKSFTAAAVDGSSTDFTLVIAAEDSAKITPDFYVVSFIFTEIATDERATSDLDQSITVYANPEATPTKSVARQTLEAMEAALVKLTSSPASGKLSVSFNGESYTNRNLKDFQDAIERQRAVVAAEEGSLTGHRRLARILHPI